MTQLSPLQKAKEIFEAGGVVIYPTETSYAIGCLLDNTKAISQLYKIKKRPAKQPTSAVFADLDQVKSFCNLTKDEETVAEAFWPGPLTICIQARENVPKSLLAPDGTLGVRVPDFPWLRELLGVLAAPALAPSANFKGQKAPAKFDQIDKVLFNLVDYVVDIEPAGRQPSTIVKLNGKSVSIIREGEISQAQIIAKLKGV